MTELEIVLKSIELIEAINENNLEKTQEIVNYFNEFNNDIELTQYIPIYELLQKHRENSAYLYMLDNLNHLSEADKVKWHITVENLRKEKNNTDTILHFISTIINSDQTIPIYKVNSLLMLSIKIDRYDLLALIK